MKHLKLLLLLLVPIFCLLGCESAMNKGTQSGIDTKTEEMTTSEASIDAVLSFVKDVYPQKYKTLLLTKEALKPEFVTNVSYEKNKFFAPTMDNTGRELDTLLCVVNFGNDEGFAIVSTQDNQILAVTESGDLSVEELIMDYSDEDFENNPKAVISNYVANYISSLPTIPVGPIGPTLPPGGPAIPTDSIDMGYAINGSWEIESQLNPLVQIKIGQQNGYNKYCKNSVDSLVAVGCGTIAIVQMMSANKYPNTIGNLTYNWDTIINQYKTNSATKDALAQWIRTIGGQCNIDYYNSRSGCNIIDMKNCISFYQRYYNVNYISNPSFENVFLMLTNNTPLVFLGWRITEKK